MEHLLTIILPCYFIFLGKVGSLPLIGSPSTATEGDLFTLTCGNRSSGSRDITNWYLNDSKAFTTSYELGEPNNCTIGTEGSHRYRYMAQRVTVSCDTHQHNITLTINSTLDSGSEWSCEDGSGNVGTDTRTRSVTLIINVTTPESTSTSTYGSSTSTSTSVSSTSDNSRRGAQNNVYIVAGGGGGGLIIIVCILRVACQKRRRIRHGHSVKENRPAIKNEHINATFQQDSSDGDIMVENDLYERTSNVISPPAQDRGNRDVRQVEGQTVKEDPPANSSGCRNIAFQHDSGGDDIMVENHLYERSSDVISPATQDLGKTGSVTDGKVDKAQESITHLSPVVVSPVSGDDLP